MTVGRSAAKLGRRGQAAAAHAARWRQVLRALAQQAPVLAVLVAVPCLAALAENEMVLATALLAPTLILGALSSWSTRQTVKGDLRRIEAVATLALVFALSALITMPAFMSLGMAPIDAAFEATSGITTTGLSVAQNAESWPISGHFLRAWMQWCGGIVVAVAGVALLMGSGRAAKVLGEQAVGGGDYFASTRAKARLILACYGTITVIGVLISIPLFPGWWEGPMIALAAVSTGGFSPRDNSLADYSTAAQIFTFLLCLTTAISLLFYAVLWKRGPRIALSRSSVTTMLTLVLAGLVLTAAGHIALNGWAPLALLDSALTYVSAHTTAGFSVGSISPTTPLLFMFLAAMIIGGDIGSTTGGLKTERVTTLARMVGLIFLRLRLPERAVSHVKVGAKRVETGAILFATALLSIYLLSAFLLWLALFAGGHPALPALFDAVSALSGVGLSAGVVGPDLSAPLKALVIVAMLLGRLEFFVFIALFLPSTWIKRS